MKKFLIQHKKWVIAGGVFILLLFIWLFPYFFGLESWYTLANVFLQILLTIMVFLMVAFVFFMTHVKQSKQMMVVEQVEKQVETKKELKFYYKHLKTIFKNWGAQKKHFLKQLPWYLLLGQAGSGKSSFVASTNLSFILGSAGGPPANHYDCRFSKEGVFVELPLEIEENKSPSISWSALLKFIKRNRRGGRLNGALVTIDFPNTLFNTEEQNIKQQTAIRSALHCIHQSLKTQLPVYLVLTKCDLIAGFREFFADVNKEDRDQVWGVAFPKTPFADRAQAVSYFETEFDLLIEKLYERLLRRLEMERHTDHRALISYFPQQIQLCKTLFSDLIVQDESAQIRGIYFVSSLQEGMPVDALMQTLSSNFELNRKAPFNSLPQKKSYFVRQFFGEIVLPEANLVFNCAYWQRWRLLTYKANLTLAGLVLFTGIAGFFSSYLSNQDNLKKMMEYLPTYHQAVSEFSPEDQSLVEIFTLLASVKKIQSLFDTQSYWAIWLELYEPLKIRGQINTVWESLLSQMMMPRVATRIEALLQEDELDAEVLYQALKGCLVFNGQADSNPEWLKSPIAYDLTTTLPDQLDEQEQLNGYLIEALQQPIATKSLDESVIGRARERLKEVPPVQFAYYEMKQGATHSQNQFNLDDKLGADFSNIFAYVNTHAATIPALYTYDGYKNLQGKRSELLISHTAETYKILGLDPNVDLTTLGAQMTPMLWALYSIDYAQQWQTLLENIKVAPFANLPHAIQTLDNFLTPRSSLIKLLQVIKENTSPIRSKYVQVSQQFSAINNVIGVSKSAAQYAQVLKTMAALRDYLTTLANSPNVTQAEFQDAVAIMQNKLPNNPIVLLRAQAQQLPAPLNSWITDIANHSMGLLLQGAHQVANNAWRNNVMPYYTSHIKGRFPFSSQSSNPVNVTNFGAFFGSNGVFSQFFQTYLAPFMGPAQDGAQYAFGEHTLGLSEHALLQLNRALLIRNMYFQNADNNPNLQFLIKPLYLDTEASSVNVQLGSQSIHYRHGPQQSISWRWPVLGDAQQVSVSFSDFQSRNYSRTLDGPWAWFELLSVGSLEETDISGRYVWTIKDDQHQASFELSAPSNLPVFDLQLLEAFHLPDNI